MQPKSGGPHCPAREGSAAIAGSRSLERGRPRWAALFAALTLCSAALACGGGDARSAAQERVGNLSDRSYFALRGKPARVSASGARVRMEQFEGRFVWAEYAAPWCSPCADQAAAIRRLDRSLGREVVFLTILTSDVGGYGHPATRKTARSWARKHRLAPKRVLAADLTGQVIPRHILFSPEGQMLFLETGYMPAEQIRAVIEQRGAEWRRWQRSGELAAWMRAD
jgi:hypothetical protein